MVGAPEIGGIVAAVTKGGGEVLDPVVTGILLAIVVFVVIALIFSVIAIILDVLDERRNRKYRELLDEIDVDVEEILHGGEL